MSWTLMEKFFPLKKSKSKFKFQYVIQRQLKKIVAAAGNDADPYPIGALTSENRDVWTDARKELLRTSEVNQESLDILAKSMFLVCLDDTNFVTREEVIYIFNSFTARLEELFGTVMVKTVFMTSQCNSLLWKTAKLVSWVNIPCLMQLLPAVSVTLFLTRNYVFVKLT